MDTAWRRLTLALLLVACISAMAAADNSYCHVFADFNYAGNDIGGPVTLNNIYECADRCFNNTNCLAFAFGDGKNCWIKGAFGNPTVDNKWTTVLTGFNDCRGLFWKNQP